MRLILGFEVRHPVSMAWSVDGFTLAVATGINHPILPYSLAKGAVYLYSVPGASVQCVLGKHTKAISAAEWSSDGLLFCLAQDDTVTVSNAAGDTLRSLSAKGATGSVPRTPHALFFSVGASCLLVLDYCNATAASRDIRFDAANGDIVGCAAHGDRLHVLFSRGWLVSISTGTPRPRN